jgi:hypothetical protein
MNRLTPSQARTLRALTKNGQLRTFATSLVNDAHSRCLRELVDSGYLTYEYTGTQRVYTLTEACNSRFPGRREGKTMAKRKIKEATNGHVEAGTVAAPAASPAEETGNGTVHSIATPEVSRRARAATGKSRQKAHDGPAAPSRIKQKANDEPAPASKIKQKVHDEPAPTPPAPPAEEEVAPAPARTRSKPRVSHPDTPSPTLAEMLAVGEIAAEHGGAKKLLALVARVDDLATKVGGLDRLRRALEGLETLSKLFK